MTPETIEGINPELVEYEDGLSYQKLFASEREEVLAADPFAGYERVRGKLGPRLEPRFKQLAESLLDDENHSCHFLWHPIKGEVWMAGMFADGRYQGYNQQQAGFRRYEGRYITPLDHASYKHVQEDSLSQQYEIGLVEKFDLISDAFPTDNPDYDPITGEAVEQMIQQWVRYPADSNGFGGHLENGDWICAVAADFGVTIPEYDADQAWLALRCGGDSETYPALAARIGHNARVYHQHIGTSRGASLLSRTGMYSEGLGKNDGHLILVPLEVGVG